MKRYTNPFIKTPVQRNLELAIRDYKIWFHMLDYGDPVEDGFHSVNLMAIVLLPATKDKADAATLAEGIRIFKECTEFNSWRKSYIKPVNAAMDVILKRFPTLPTDVCVRAVREALMEAA